MHWRTVVEHMCVGSSSSVALQPCPDYWLPAIRPIAAPGSGPAQPGRFVVVVARQSPVANVVRLRGDFHNGSCVGSASSIREGGGADCDAHHERTTRWPPKAQKVTKHLLLLAAARATHLVTVPHPQLTGVCSAAYRLRAVALEEMENLCDSNPISGCGPQLLNLRVGSLVPNCDA
jgi:hypothetical protein